jgi:TolB-like protein
LGTLANNSGTWRFGVYEADAHKLELRRKGVLLRLRDQSFRILVHLLEHAGEVVTRDELQRKLWSADTYVDFDHSLNTAMMTLRDVLGDEADAPVYIETIPKRGYRFIAPVVPIRNEEQREAPTTVATTAAKVDEGFSIAVLPFKCTGNIPEMAVFAEGLAEEFAGGFLRFSYLRVVSSNLAQQYAVVSATDSPGPRYVLQGSLHQMGTRLRVTARLADMTTTTNIWSETYEQPFHADSLFDLQDYLVPRIVSTIADGRGILPRSISESLRYKHIDLMTPNEAVLRAFAHFERVTAEEHAASRAALERAVQRAPGQADCWAMLSLLYKEEFAHDFNLEPDSLTRAFSAAQVALQADATNHLCHHALAAALFFRGDIPAFRAAAERAITLNPMDGFTVASLGFLLADSGEWELGCALVDRARELNPHHPILIRQ